MPHEKTPEEQILENALAPKRASGDSGSMEQHPIADQLAALDRFNATQPPANGTRRIGWRLFKLIPPGSD